MEVQFSSSGIPNSDNCRFLGGDCNPGRSSWDCHEYFDEYEGNLHGLNSYWVFQAVYGLANKLDVLQTSMMKETLYTSLKVQEMIGTFEAPETGAPDVLGWLVSAGTGVGATRS